MEFRLIYQGELLPSAGTNKRSSEKHEIRKSFHPQLKRLWAVKDGLRQLAEHKGQEAVGKNKALDSPDKSWSEQGLAAIGRNWNRKGFDFVPLITSTESRII
jgi:hypothetical protein